MPRGLIVVGVDGSENSRQALRWALDEARLRQAQVRVVHAWWMYPMLADGMDDPHSISDASGAVQKFVTETLGEQDDVEVETVAGQGQQASAALVGGAKDAELLVVGSRGAGGFSSLLLGSVNQQCAQHAPCPVAIVRRGLADSHPQHDARAEAGEEP
jgi:nucleotide-binding universal stress UspA family protein